MIKKVLFVASIYKPNIGGIETAIDELSKEYKRLGIASTVLTKQYPFDLPEYENDNGVNIIRVKRPHTDEQYIQTLRELLKKRELKADVIHVVGVRRPLPLFALFLSRYYKIPVVMTFAGNDVIHDQESIKIWKEYEDDTRNSIEQAKNYISYSNGISTAVRKLFSNIGQIHTVYAGIDMEKIEHQPPIDSEKKYIITARRLIKNKGIDTLINAFNLLQNDFPDLYLYIVGEGDEKEALIKQVKELNLTDKVVFTGSLSLGKLISYLKGGLVHVCPSRVEGGGIVNVEASACGCVPIGSNVDGIPEYIKDNETGLLFRKDDAKDLSEKITKLLKDQVLYQRLRLQGYSFARNFAIPNVARQYLDIYEQASIPCPIVPWSDKIEKMCEVINDE